MEEHLSMEQGYQSQIQQQNNTQQPNEFNQTQQTTINNQSKINENQSDMSNNSDNNDSDNTTNTKINEEYHNLNLKNVCENDNKCESNNYEPPKKKHKKIKLKEMFPEAFHNVTIDSNFKQKHPNRTNQTYSRFVILLIFLNVASAFFCFYFFFFCLHVLVCKVDVLFYGVLRFLCVFMCIYVYYAFFGFGFF